MTKTIPFAGIDEISDAISDPEITAMRKIDAAFAPLSRTEQIRVLRAVAILYSISIPGITSPVEPPPAPRPAVTTPRYWYQGAPRRKQRAKQRARHCRSCGATGHDRRKCPLDFEITITNK